MVDCYILQHHVYWGEYMPILFFCNILISSCQATNYRCIFGLKGQVFVDKKIWFCLFCVFDKAKNFHKAHKLSCESPPPSNEITITHAEGNSDVDSTYILTEWKCGVCVSSDKYTRAAVLSLKNNCVVKQVRY